jgi:Leishmanolysin
MILHKMHVDILLLLKHENKLNIHADTGWYRANYEMASELSWGKNLGCDFVMKSCKSWITSRHSE